MRFENRFIPISHSVCEQACLGDIKLVFFQISYPFLDVFPFQMTTLSSKEFGVPNQLPNPLMLYFLADFLSLSLSFSVRRLFVCCETVNTHFLFGGHENEQRGFFLGFVFFWRTKC